MPSEILLEPHAYESVECAIYRVRRQAPRRIVGEHTASSIVVGLGWARVDELAGEHIPPSLLEVVEQADGQAVLIVERVQARAAAQRTGHIANKVELAHASDGLGDLERRHLARLHAAAAKDHARHAAREAPERLR
eukprot:4626440-Prymnesium_polylepis.1